MGLHEAATCSQTKDFLPLPALEIRLSLSLGTKLPKSVSKEYKLCVRLQKEMCNQSIFFKKSAFF